MKKVIISTLFIVTGLISQNNCFAQTLNNGIDSLSYSIGVLMGENTNYGIEQMASQSKITPNLDVLISGFEQAVRKSGTFISKETANEYISKFMTQIQEKAISKNKEEGKAFLAENKKKKGVKETPSGLQYLVLTDKKGEKPTVESDVTVNYKGYLLDETVFDSSYDRGEPATFKLNQVIPGWTEGVQLMSPGAKYRFWVPSDLAYGDRGASAQIEGGRLLVFDIELISINKENVDSNPAIGTRTVPAE
jgi:FKBP-type peptidyl-prolyl cis-trans isomerase